jgi:hypothetical protein
MYGKGPAIQLMFPSKLCGAFIMPPRV